MCMCHIVTCGLPQSTIFFHIISERTQCFKQKSLNTIRMFWFSLQILSEKFPILRRIQKDTIINVYISSRKVAVIVVSFQSKGNFLDRFSGKKNTQISNFMKIRQVGNHFLHVDGRTKGQTERHEGTKSRFSKFCECG